MFCMLKKKKIYPAYVSKLNSDRGKRVILLMIPNGEGWFYLEVKKLRRVTSEHHSDFFCLICFHSLASENKCESHKKVFRNKGFCNIIMPSETTKILQFIQYQKSDVAPFIIYADLECLIET